MTTLREAAQQALEALLTPSGAQACSTCQNGPENEYCCRMEMWSAIAALRAALAQQAEPLNLSDPAVQKRLAAQWGYVHEAQQAEPETCTWHQDGDSESGVYATSCRRYFNLEDGTPEGNKMQWCCYCGKKLMQELITEDDDE